MVNALRGQRGKRFALDGLLRSSKSQRREDQALIVEYTSQSHVKRLQDELEDPAVRQRLTEAVQQAFGAPLEVRPALLQQDNTPSGHLVRAAQRLGGRVVSQEEITSQGGGG